MTKKQMKQVIFMGVGCVILLIAGIIYSLLFNDARWVKNMDMSNYVFSIKDIPMLIVGALIEMCIRDRYMYEDHEQVYILLLFPLNLVQNALELIFL